MEDNCNGEYLLISVFTTQKRCPFYFHLHGPNSVFLQMENKKDGTAELHTIIKAKLETEINETTGSSHNQALIKRNSNEIGSI